MKRRELYGAYSPEADMTFVVETIYEETDARETITTGVCGFYFGEPSDEVTESFDGRTSVTTIVRENPETIYCIYDGGGNLYEVALTEEDAEDTCDYIIERAKHAGEYDPSFDDPYIETIRSDVLEHCLSVSLPDKGFFGTLTMPMKALFYFTDGDQEIALTASEVKKYTGHHVDDLIRLNEIRKAYKEVKGEQ